MDARVSLTLLNHHSGSKAQLLAAVDKSCAIPGVRCTAQLKWLMRDGSGSYSLFSILSAWVRAEFAAAAEIDGASLISFLALFAVEGEVENQELTERQDTAGEMLIAGLQGCTPMASRRAAESAYLFASGATTRFLLGSPRVFGLYGTRELAKATDGDEARLLVPLFACVETALLMVMSRGVV